jgi:hypothetical protein
MVTDVLTMVADASGGILGCNPQKVAKIDEKISKN